MLSAVANDPTLSISQPAVAPDGPIGKGTIVILVLGLVAGFTLAATVALLMEHFARRVRDEHDLVAAYPLPVLARVPKVRDRLFADGDLTAVPIAVREAYSTLQVQVEQFGPRPRIVLVTSGSGGEGKTSTALNLALGLIAAGHSVLLMDLDLRKPDLTRILGMAESADVMALVSAQATVADLVVATRLPPLRVVPGGRGGQVAGLGALTQRLPSIFADARGLADYVVVDTAPLGWVSDALRLVPYVDDVLISVRPGATERARFEVLRDLLTRAAIVPAGIVIVGTAAGNEDSYPYGTVQA